MFPAPARTVVNARGNAEGDFHVPRQLYNLHLLPHLISNPLCAAAIILRRVGNRTNARPRALLTVLTWPWPHDFVAWPGTPGRCVRRPR